MRKGSFYSRTGNQSSTTNDWQFELSSWLESILLSLLGVFLFFLFCCCCLLLICHRAPENTPCLAQSVYQKGRHTYPPTQTINPHFYRFQGCWWWWKALEPNQEQHGAKTPIQSMFTMSMAQELCDKGGQLLILEATVFWLQVYSTLNPWSSLPEVMNLDRRPTEDVCLICITICGRRKDKQ